jgi:hypothetical protein
VIAVLMLIDNAVLSYYHVIRVKGWLGNFSRGGSRPGPGPSD